jgi:hypothetical protein
MFTMMFETAEAETTTKVRKPITEKVLGDEELDDEVEGQGA